MRACRLLVCQRCLQHKAPQYMTDCCIHTPDIARRQHLQSAGCHQLLVPRHRRSMFGRRVLSVAGPAAWNSLPDCLRDPSRSFYSFRPDISKTFFSRFTRVHSALEALRLALYKLTLTFDSDIFVVTSTPTISSKAFQFPTAPSSLRFKQVLAQPRPSAVNVALV